MTVTRRGAMKIAGGAVVATVTSVGIGGAAARAINDDPVVPLVAKHFTMRGEIKRLWTLYGRIWDQLGDDIVEPRVRIGVYRDERTGEETDITAGSDHMIDDRTPDCWPKRRAAAKAELRAKIAARDANPDYQRMEAVGDQMEALYEPADAVLREIWETPATTLAGALGKLRIVRGDPDWMETPVFESAIADLERMAGHG